jgi:integrase/recombinase XerD
VELPAFFEQRQEMILRRMSWRTIKAYKQCFRAYLIHIGDENVDLKGKDDIRAYLLLLINQRNISDSYQNSVINALKFYYEKVLGIAPQYIDVPRPKATEEQPEILNQPELRRLFDAVDNLKRKLILKLIYCGG